jgi:FtsZ-binding cell division protein ZapB
VILTRPHDTNICLVLIVLCICYLKNRISLVLIILCIFYIKHQHEREKNGALRRENDKIRNENLKIKEVLKATICEACGGPPFPVEDHQHFVQEMQQENAQLKQEASELIYLINLF